MKLSLKNIGIIKNSTIDIEDLTIITGPNNSGKSTVGKALYALISSTENYLDKSILGISQYSVAQIREAIYALNRDIRLFYWYEIEEKKESLIETILINKKYFFENQAQIREFIKKIIVEINDIHENKLDGFSESFKKIIGKKKNKAINISKSTQILNNLDSKLQTNILNDYLNLSIINQLNEEFNYQIAPVRDVSALSELTLSINNKDVFNISILKGELIKKIDKVDTILSKAFFIDDAFILDDLGDYSKKVERTDRFSPYNRDNSFENYVEVRNHNKEILKKLYSKEENLVKEIFNKKDATRIFEIINSLIPGDIYSSSGKYLYSENKLDIKNLATGSKMFAIIKILLMKGLLDSESILILDEPEIHLHPEWQNKFAQILVLLNRELKVKILLTTHSPNFLLALDVFAEEYKISNINFYQSVINSEDGSVIFENVNSKTYEIYRKLLKPFIDLESKKNKNYEY